jgi:hypothetical protein
MLASGEALPGVLAQAGGGAAHAFVPEEVLHQVRAEGGHGVERLVGGERVDDVPHGVGRDQAGVVATRVHGLEVPFERDVDREVAKAAILAHLHQPNLGLAVAVGAEWHAQLPR